MTNTSRVYRRIIVPAAPREIERALRIPIAHVRAILHILKRRRLARRLDRVVPVASRRGRAYEHLWARAA